MQLRRRWDARVSPARPSGDPAEARQSAITVRPPPWHSRRADSLTIESIPDLAKTAKKPAKTRDVFDLPEPAPRSVSGRRPMGMAGNPGVAGFSAQHIEVLEWLEPVRRRPGM
jgi:hypothetical protein